MKHFLVIVAALLWTGLAAAQTFPTRPVRIVVPFPPAGAVDIQEDRFFLTGKGNLVDLVPDETASNGKAARMPGGHVDWATQFHIPKDSKEFGKGPWTCYFVIRVKLNNKSGSAFTYGLFDQKSQTHIAMEGIGMDMAGDEKYHAYAVKLPELRPGMFFWVAGPGTDAVEGVYIDRIYVVKDTKP